MRLTSQLLYVVVRVVSSEEINMACVVVRFDADLARLQEETKHERNLKEKAIRDKDLSVSERLQLEEELEVSLTIVSKATRNFCCSWPVTLTKKFLMLVGDLWS